MTDVAIATSDETAQVVAYALPVNHTLDLLMAEDLDEAQVLGFPAPATDLFLAVDADDIFETPSVIDVEIGNGEDFENIVFNLSSATGYWDAIGTAQLDEDGMAEVTVELPAIPAGTYTLQAAGDRSSTAYASVLVQGNPLAEQEEAVERDTPRPPDLSAPDLSYRWRLIDTTVGHEAAYTLPRNPARWTNPNPPNNLEHDVTVAPDGNMLAWEGAQRSWTFEFSGYLDTPEEYGEFLHWASLNRRFWLVDHRNVARLVTFDQFDAKARIVPNRPWAHDYTMRVLHFFRSDFTGEVD